MLRTKHYIRRKLDLSQIDISKEILACMQSTSRQCAKSVIASRGVEKVLIKKICYAMIRSLNISTYSNFMLHLSDVVIYST